MQHSIRFITFFYNGCVKFSISPVERFGELAVLVRLKITPFTYSLNILLLASVQNKLLQILHCPICDAFGLVFASKLCFPVFASISFVDLFIYSMLFVAMRRKTILHKLVRASFDPMFDLRLLFAYVRFSEFQSLDTSVCVRFDSMFALKFMFTCVYFI